jgi:hypothetical protein
MYEKEITFLRSEFQREKDRHQNFINLAVEANKNMFIIINEITRLSEKKNDA